MAVFKCKMCGGTIEFNQGDTVGVCDSCGTKQTLPKLDDEKRVQLYDRANYFRRENEFDKAMGIYEMIIADEKEDAEAYWGIVLCKYGIEYVEDPRTHKRIPTVNRAQYTSFFDDEDYKSAMKYADGYQRDIYEAEAKAIDIIQKGILEISNKEEPFDVFICYKETDATGNRTQDSVYAQDIYKALINEGYKVFFSRITLETKLGQQYEPYIFAALNSAKVMLAIGTRKENFESVWVKNEWSRFLALTKNDKSKVLIPCYKDISPYDMPEEFTYLQSQDMGKIGFMQDLLHGISKVVKKTTTKDTVVINSGNAEVEPLLKRAFMFLEDEELDRADEFAEQVLNRDPENAIAYVVKLMVDLKLRKQEQLGEYIEGFENNQNYQKARRYASAEINSMLDGYLVSIESKKQENAYTFTLNKKNTARSKEEYIEVAELFEKMKDYKDSKELASVCREKAEETRKEAIYNDAYSLLNRSQKQTKADDLDVVLLETAINELRTIVPWKDAELLIEQCQKAKIKMSELAEKEKAKVEKASKKRKKIIAIVASAICACIALAIVFVTVAVPNIKYSSAISNIEEGNIIEGYDALVALNGLKDSAEKAEAVRSQYIKEKLKTAEVGSTVVLGKFEQDNDASNGTEDIEWLVLAKEDKKALIISKQGLCHLEYDSSDNKRATWESCTLRTWLNGKFIETAFYDYENKMIQTTKVTAGENPDYVISPGNDTNDKVFLLSITEANKYFDSDEARMCSPTDYALEQDVYVDRNSQCCWWWLRTSGESEERAACVRFEGFIFTKGLLVFDEYTQAKAAVRPAMWISLE